MLILRSIEASGRERRESDESVARLIRQRAYRRNAQDKTGRRACAHSVEALCRILRSARGARAQAVAG